MPMIMTRRSPLKVSRWKGALPVSIETLQMMVMSGVVRRADLNPPLMPHRLGSRSPEPSAGGFPQHSVSEQGWLSRMILGRKPQGPVVNRF
jgi:hypothetical protein